jgi:hypothetical protein
MSVGDTRPYNDYSLLEVEEHCSNNLAGPSIVVVTVAHIWLRVRHTRNHTLSTTACELIERRQSLILAKTATPVGL